MGRLRYRLHPPESEINVAYTDWYTWRLVDLAGNVIEDNLHGLSDGRVTGNVATAIRWQGTVTSEVPPWWDLWRTRLQPVYHRTGREPEVVGTFHARPETWDYDGGRHTTKLALYDPTIHVQEDETWGLWTETKGLNIAGRVRVILNTIGLRVAVTPSAETLRRDLVFEDTVTKLRVINDLLDAGGFFALHVDPFGQFQVVPYTPPQQRPVVYSFSERIDAEHTRNVSGTIVLHTAEGTKMFLRLGNVLSKSVVRYRSSPSKSRFFLCSVSTRFSA